MNAAITCRVGWCFLWFLLLIALPGEALARDTYVVFAKRLVASETADRRFRADLEQYLLGATNGYRKAQGRSRLSANARNLGAARAHAMDMAQNDFVGHVASTGQGFDSRMRAFRPGALFLPRMGENAARVSSAEAANAAKASKLMQQWINSSSHRKALVSKDFTSVSTGVVQRGNKLYAVQIFSGPEVKSNLGSQKAAGTGLY